MPKVGEETKKTKFVAGQVTTGIAMTESEKYHTERERYFEGKRVFEIPADNYYSLDQRTETKK